MFKMFKGKTTIELTDIETGEVSVVEETNFFTNAYRDLCQPILRTHSSLRNARENYTGDICLTQLSCGLVCFDSPLEENPDKYFPPITANMVAHGSVHTYSGPNLAYGSFNNNLSDISSENTRKYIWDFTAEQGNGTIASVCLTPIRGGIIGHGTKTPFENSAGYLPLFGHIQICYNYAFFKQTRVHFVPIYLSFEGDYVVFMQINNYAPSKKITITKMPIWSNKADIFKRTTPVSTPMSTTNYIGHGYSEQLFDEVIDLSSAITFSGSSVGVAQDGKYLYIAFNANGQYYNSWAINSKIQLAKINLEDFTYEVIEVTNTTGEVCTVFCHPDASYIYEPFYYGFTFGVSNGYMFVNSVMPSGTSGKSGHIYAISLEDNTIVHKVTDAEGNDNVVTTTTSTSQYNTTFNFGMTVNGKIMFSDTAYRLNYRRNAQYLGMKCVSPNDFIVKGLGTPYWGLAENDSTSNYEQYVSRAFPTDNPLYFCTCNPYNMSTGYTQCNFYVHAMPNFLLTVNNLQTPVTKTPSQTMRITYTLTKEE
jgi:hypothetical protein